MTRCTFALVAIGLALSGCAHLPGGDPMPAPPERPAAAAAAADKARSTRQAARRAAEDAAEAEAAANRQESAALTDYYARIEDGLVRRGLLRTDGGGPDTPYDADRLADTFMRLAFFEEYDTSDDAFIARETESQLHRFTDPVRVETRFGDSVPKEQRAEDDADVATFAARLGKAAAHSVYPVARGGNLIVFFVNEAERRDLGPELRQLVPGLSDAAVRSVTDLPRTSYCVVFATDPGSNGSYSRAVAIIRAEHPDLLRLSCIHEELAQGLGLKNDAPLARPSIFNDDEEFALLTRHDELLLRILYDPRLTPGMRAPEAEPIVRRIAGELMAGS